MLRVHIFAFETFPDNVFDSVPLIEFVKSMEKTKTQIIPDIISTHRGGDPNIDHRIACQALMTAFRPQPTDTFAEIHCFEVCSSTECGGVAGNLPFLPDMHVNVSLRLGKLLEVYACYTEGVRPEPHARYLESLRIAALRRGREVGVAAAEAFVTLRRIIRRSEIMCRKYE